MLGENDSNSDIVKSCGKESGTAVYSHIQRPRNAGLKGLALRDIGDWRTLGLVLAVQAAILALLFYPAGTVTGWQVALSIVMLAPLMTLFSSLQHEVLHGHPFRSQVANDLLAGLPLALIVPYYRFKDTHLAHHKDVNLCDPYDDPETWYQFREDFDRRSRYSRMVFNFNNTLFGRMLIGPLIGMWGFAKCDWRQFWGGETHIGWKWALHLLLVTVLLVMVSGYSVLPVWSVLVSAYFGMSLLMVRTFIEHQAHEKVRGRSVIIENGGLFAFLFLNNSLHAVHHAYPAMAWYRLPKLFSENRERFLKLNDGYRFESYRSVFRHFFLAQKEPVPIEEALDKRHG